MTTPESVFDDILRRAEETNRDLAAERLSGVSDDGLVEVTVDGHGSVLAVRLDAEVLAGAGPHQVGSSTVQAIAAAKTAATTMGERFAKALLDEGWTGRGSEAGP